MLLTAAERRLEDWHDAGLITLEQAEAIRAHEATTRKRVPLLLEGLGYLGLVLVLFAGGLVMAPVWETMPDGARIALLVLLDGALVAAGLVLHRADEPAAHRFREVLWFAALGLTAVVTGWFTGEILGWSFDAAGIAIGVVTLAHALVLHGIRQGVMTQVGGHVAVITTVECTIALVTEDEMSILIGGAAALIGLGWFVAGLRELIRPGRTALVLGAITSTAGVSIAFVELPSELPSLVAGLAASVVFAFLGSRHQEPVLVVLGGIGMLSFGIPILGEFFGEMPGAPLVFLALGGVILVGVIRQLRRSALDA